jgi:hypothetical protein
MDKILKQLAEARAQAIATGDSATVRKIDRAIAQRVATLLDTTLLVGGV